MASPAPSADSVPLHQRLRRAMLIALLLGCWAPFKIVWEQRIAHEQDVLRYHGVVMTRQLRDQLGQGLTIGVLSGMRSVVADFIFVINMTLAWEKEEWFKMATDISLATALQPRAPTFWDIGGWQLAWNASIAAANDPTLPSDLRRIKASRFWLDRGLDVYLRGIENNPNSWKLWTDTGLLYQQRLKDFPKAAIYYQHAALIPGCPVFYERFPAYMYENAGDDPDAYEAWKALWYRLTPEQREMKEHWKEKIEQHTRKLEQKLSIPKEKRVFPN
jgi:tetratricopeptide (TPR) repeat protein